MPIMDPSIYQNAFKPTVPLQDPMESMGKALQIQGMMQQHQMGGIQLQNAQQDQQDQQGLRRLMATGKYKTPGELADAAQEGNAASPKAIMGLRAADLEQQQKKALLQKTFLESDDLERKYLEQLTDTVGNAANATLKIEDPQARYVAWQQKLPEIAARIQPVAGDSPKIQQWKQSTLEQMKNEYQGLGNLTGPDALDSLLTAHANDSKKHSEWFEEAKAQKQREWESSRPQDPIAKLKQDLDNELITQAQYDARARVLNTSMATVINNQGAGTSGGKTWETPLPDPGREAKAQAIARGEQPLLEESSRAPGNREVNSRAAYLAEVNGKPLAGKTQIGLNYKALSDFEGSGAANKTIRALNTMTEHVATARRMAQALDSGDIPLFNRLSQALAEGTGKPAPTNFDTLREFLAGEVDSVAAGGHITETGIKSAADKLKKSQSPAQLSGALDTMDEVAAGKLVALNKDYTQIPGNKGSLEGKLTSATLKAFQAVQKRQGEGAEAPPPALPKTVTMADVRANAQKYGKTVDQIIKDLSAKGIGVQ